MRDVVRSLAVICAALLIVACSSNEDKEPVDPLPLVEFEQTLELQKVWVTRVSGSQFKKYFPLRKLGKRDDPERKGKRRFTRLVPTIVEDKIYAAEEKGVVYALNLATGELLWTKAMPMEISAGTSVEDGKLFLGTYDGMVIALDANNGEELWRAESSGEILAAPQSNGSEVVVSAIDGGVTAFRASDGEQLWTYGHTTPALTLRGSAAPLVTSTQVIAAFDNGQVLAFDVNDGSSAWEVRVAQPTGRHDLERIVDIDGTPLQQGGFVYVASYQGAIVALARAQGRIIWKQDISTWQPLVYDNDTVYAVTDDSRVVAYNGSNGATVWENTQMLRRGLGAPAIIGDYIAAMDEKGYLHVMNQADGLLVARILSEGKGFSSPLIGNSGNVYALADDGNLSTYTIKPQD